MTSKEDLKDGQYCELGLPCCQFACRSPRVCVSGHSQCFCLNSRASFPFGEHVPSFVCALLAIQCAPSKEIYLYNHFILFPIYIVFF